MGTGLTATELLIFIGNPGVGKSTLVNSIVGQEVFTSGVNPGIGLTQSMQMIEHNCRQYIDTPGLADGAFMNQAGQEIRKALSHNGVYRIFFVINLSSGRISPEDINTIKRVSESIRCELKCFSLIINMVKKSERHLENSINSEIVKALSVYGLDAAHIYYLDVCRELENGERELLEISDEFNNFLHSNSCSFQLSPADVFDIDTRDINTLRRDNELEKQKQLKKLAEQNRKAEELRLQTVQLEAAKNTVNQQAFQIEYENRVQGASRSGCTGLYEPAPPKDDCRII